VILETTIDHMIAFGEPVAERRKAPDRYDSAALDCDRAGHRRRRFEREDPARGVDAEARTAERVDECAGAQQQHGGAPSPAYESWAVRQT
jgi:hypothetical protein